MKWKKCQVLWKIEQLLDISHQRSIILICYFFHICIQIIGIKKIRFDKKPKQEYPPISFLLTFSNFSTDVPNVSLEYFNNTILRKFLKITDCVAAYIDSITLHYSKLVWITGKLDLWSKINFYVKLIADQNLTIGQCYLTRSKKSNTFKTNFI
ncbi:hypothetical protein BpHYR1_025931 [Brachionus plicatilis]|uniref:Uncharacterized protein n=1 Tax=Brachionus plicatilis TaxID=10195 RepID=A0A3M7SMG0_BRAPC|nr:hypothetical protein BpHYR1_025931 [Brachionus plicatilis]